MRRSSYARAVAAGAAQSSSIPRPVVRAVPSWWRPSAGADAPVPWWWIPRPRAPEAQSS
jgi:hypothetical protein